MRRTIALLFAIVLVMGMTQCKKKADTIANVGGEKIQITLDVDGGKHVINPGESGEVSYESDDVIYVGDGSRFIGKLTHNGTKFVGEVNTPVGDKLHFYFIGGFAPSETPEQGTTTEFTVDISDQSSKLPVLSYASVSYVSGQHAYTCMLENQCGLVKFVPSTEISKTIKVGGMKTTATIDFATPGITPKTTTGEVTLYPQSNSEKWAILLPQEVVSNPQVTIVDFIGSGTIASVPKIDKNMYHNSGVIITVTTP